MSKQQFNDAVDEIFLKVRGLIKLVDELNDTIDRADQRLAALKEEDINA